MNITILGCGFGTALAVLLDNAGHKVRAYTKFQAELDDILKYGEHKRLLPGVIIAHSIEFYSDISCVAGADLIIFAIPSQFVRETARLVAEVSEVASRDRGKAVVLNVGKGFEPDTGVRLSRVLLDELTNPVVIMAGPCHAEEVGRNTPTTVTVAPAAPEFEPAARMVQAAINTPAFRVYYTRDVIGCELGAALKNCIALACGILDGLGYGDNTRAALMTRGLAEITRLGVALGADYETFLGLAGVGDLIVTCTSNHSRNHRAGVLIGQGVSPELAVTKIGTVEGYAATKMALRLAGENGVRIPIITGLYGICFEGTDPLATLNSLMARPQREEVEHFYE